MKHLLLFHERGLEDMAGLSTIGVRAQWHYLKQIRISNNEIEMG